MRSNCVIFAVLLWWRRRGRSRTIRLRKSRLGSWFPHVLYVEHRHYGERVVHFVPHIKAIRRIPPPLFHGHSKWGDLP